MFRRGDGHLQCLCGECNSRRLHHFWRRSSIVEQRPFKPLVVGASPTGATNLLEYLGSNHEKLIH